MDRYRALCALSEPKNSPRLLASPCTLPQTTFHRHYSPTAQILYSSNALENPGTSQDGNWLNMEEGGTLVSYSCLLSCDRRESALEHSNHVTHPVLPEVYLLVCTRSSSIIVLVVSTPLSSSLSKPSGIFHRVRRAKSDGNGLCGVKIWMEDL